VLEHYRRYAAVLLDTHTARIVVFALGEVVRTAGVENEKTHRTDVGGWSQSRYQRHVDAIRERHVKEVVAELLARTLEAIGEHDARDDREKVERLLAAYRAGGLGVAGLEATLAALENGQVYDLVITATGDALGGHGDELVARARRTGATVTFVEDPALLADVDGVGGLLRHRIGGVRAAA
jgi:peptide subunit release factor 1 (eRF1)